MSAITDIATTAPVHVVDVDAHEGPVYFVSVVVADGNGANGMADDGAGGLLVCEQGSHTEGARISRLDRGDGRRETVVEDWRGLPFNSPNDVVADLSGAVWFTDPSYGHLQGFRPQPLVGDYVYRHDPISGRTGVQCSRRPDRGDLAARPRQLLFRRTGAQLVVHHHRYGDLGRRD
jgi:sugar lactone lactonase YvrE